MQPIFNFKSPVNVMNLFIIFCQVDCCLVLFSVFVTKYCKFYFEKYPENFYFEIGFLKISVKCLIRRNAIRQKIRQ